MSVTISPSLYITAPAVSLSNARIGWKKLTGTITASSSAGGFPASDADHEMTYNAWKPVTLPATWELDCTTSKSANYIGLAAHTLGDSATTVYAEYWSGSAWVEIDSQLPGDNSPIMFLFETELRTKYRIRLTGATVPKIGVIYIGETLDMQRGLSGGNPHITLSRVTRITNSSSETGQFLGRTTIPMGSTAAWSWSALEPDWYRANFDPFVVHARSKPYFIAWRPLEYPTEIGYCWTAEDIRPTNMGVRDYLSVSLNGEGLGVD